MNTKEKIQCLRDSITKGGAGLVNPVTYDMLEIDEHGNLYFWDNLNQTKQRPAPLSKIKNFLK